MGDASTRAKVEEDSLNRAIAGLAKGSIDYGQDYLLTYVLDTYRTNVKKLTSLTEAE